MKFICYIDWLIDINKLNSPPSGSMEPYSMGEDLLLIILNAYNLAVINPSLLGSVLKKFRVNNIFDIP